MQITIIKNNKLTLFTLPTKVSGSHWITDYENGRKINLISIEATPEGWQLISGRDAYLVDSNNVMIPYVILQENNFYTVSNHYKAEKFILYCSPIYDSTFKEFVVSKEMGKIRVGNDNGCDVNYQLEGAPKNAFVIEKGPKYYQVVVESPTNLAYVNQKRVYERQKLEYGDIIFWYGLKLILMRKNGGDYFLVNNPGGRVAESVLYTTIVPESVPVMEDSEELSVDNLYANDYFYRTPHFYQTIEKFELKIDTPPSRKDDDKTPVILTIGPMVTMAMMSVVTLANTIGTVSRGEKSIDDSFQSIMMCVVMLASSLLWPLLTKAYQKFSNKMYEKKRQKLFKKYLLKKEEEIDKELNNQRRFLIENNFSIQECQDIIRARNIRLWQRRIVDEDFLTLPVGMGNKPMQIEIKYPEEHFSLEEDNLLDYVHELGGRERILRDVPITYSFYENKATGIVGDASVNKEFIDRIILQMMTMYSYDEVKIVTFTSVENASSWDYVKTIPHSWSNDHGFRYFGSTNEEYREIIYQLDHVLHERMASNQREEKPTPYYVIITDAIKSIDTYDFIKNVLASEENYGFSMIMLVDRVAALPNECKNFINVSREKSAIFNSVLNAENYPFTIDFTPIDELYTCARELANIKIDIKTESESSLPDTYHFLEMYQVGKVEQLNSLIRWKKNNPILSLQAPIGIGKSGEIISLDLHEKYHGPHGLIAGTTGSGKSEFILTYILSLAVNYSPYEVQFILIDYKGGGLALAFQNDKYTLPHIAGIMTNLDGNELNRSLASIESEVKRRQREFNEARSLTNESTIDIYKYQKLFREGKLNGMEPIAHLFIISDEFAELKEQQPEFMDKLISVARVGRSLGVHLILATQKPGGVVDAQIWSNTRFRVCLKVQDTGDSQEVLKKPDAAYLTKTGRFYLQVGYDEVYTLGQSAWTGGKYIPSLMFKTEVDSSVNMIDNLGMVLMSKDSKVIEHVEAEGEEISRTVQYLSDIANDASIHIRRLWLEKIPEKIYVDSLKSKYNFKKENYNIDIVIGEYDDPENQNQFLLSIPFSKLGNALVFGMAGSGKEEFLASLIYAGITTYTPQELEFYILDFGGETLSMFESAPQVGGIAFLNEEDKIINLFKMLEEEINNRKKLFAKFGGSYYSYLQNSGKSVPNKIVIINNYEAFVETYEDLNETFAVLIRDAAKYGIYFVISVNSGSGARMRVRQNFSMMYVLEQNNEAEYSDLLGNCRGKIPAKILGRGLFKKDKIYEFQTALMTNDANVNNYAVAVCKKLAEQIKVKAMGIPVLPEVVDFSAVATELTNKYEFVMGINKDKLNVEKFSFSKNAISLISSYEIEKVGSFLNALVNQVVYYDFYDYYFINTTEQVINNPNLNGKYITKNMDEMIVKFSDYVDKVYEIYEKNNFDNNVLVSQKKVICFVYGVYNFINKLSDDVKRKFGEMIKKDNQIGLVSFVLIDNPDVLKQYAFEDWFKSGTDTSRGVWIGSGIADQNLFKVSKITREDRDDISNDFGYVINISKLTKVKLLASFEARK